MPGVHKHFETDRLRRPLKWSRFGVLQNASPSNAYLGSIRMRELRYKQYVIGHPSGPWTTGTLKDLLLAMPYLLRDLIPPIGILNNLLRNGMPNDIYPNGLPDGKVQVDAGMSGGCAWKPFELSVDKYEELVLELLTDPERNFRQKDPPASIKTIAQWETWSLGQ